MNPSGITPLDLKVLVRPDAAEKVTKGGIIVPDSTSDRQKFAVVKATTIAVGANAFNEWLNGKEPDEVPVPEAGSRILMAQYAGARVKGQDGEDYVLMNDEDCIALLAEETSQ